VSFGDILTPSLSHVLFDRTLSKRRNLSKNVLKKSGTIEKLKNLISGNAADVTPCLAKTAILKL